MVGGLGFRNLGFIVYRTICKSGESGRQGDIDGPILLHPLLGGSPCLRPHCGSVDDEQHESRLACSKPSGVADSNGTNGRTNNAELRVAERDAG